LVGVVVHSNHAMFDSYASRCMSMVKKIYFRLW